MARVFLILLVSFILAAPTAVLAHKSHSENQGKSHLVAKFESDDEDDEDEDEIKAQSKAQSDNKFEIKGMITAVSGNSFVINGQTVNINPQVTGEFEQKGLLETGVMAKVEGQVVDGQLFAEEVKIIGQGQGRFKFEIKGLGTLFSLPTPTPSPTPPAEETTPSPTPTPSPSPEVGAAATTMANIQVKAVGPLDQVVGFIESILNFLKGLV